MYQLSIPKAEQSLYEADVKMAEAKESIVHAKEMLLEGFISGENSGKSVSNVASGSTSPADTRQPLTFDPVLASTPQNSPPPIKKEVDLACSLFDNAFKRHPNASTKQLMMIVQFLLGPQGPRDIVQNSQHHTLRMIY